MDAQDPPAPAWHIEELGTQQRNWGGEAAAEWSLDTQELRQALTHWDVSKPLSLLFLDTSVFMVLFSALIFPVYGKASSLPALLPGDLPVFRNKWRALSGDLSVAQGPGTRCQPRLLPMGGGGACPGWGGDPRICAVRSSPAESLLSKGRRKMTGWGPSKSLLRAAVRSGDPSVWGCRNLAEASWWPACLHQGRGGLWPPPSVLLHGLCFFS